MKILIKLKLTKIKSQSAWKIVSQAQVNSSKNRTLISTKFKLIRKIEHLCPTKTK